jgi:hypothetical protein
MDLVVCEGADIRCENLPTTNEVAALFNPNATEGYREIILTRRDDEGGLY